MKVTLPLLLLTLAISTATHGSSYPYPSHEDDIEKVVSATLFTKIDTNKNSKISFDEVYHYRTQEMRKQREARAGEMLARCDKNKDGKIGNDELKTFSMNDFDPIRDRDVKPNNCRMPTEILASMDINGDGSITKKEIVEASMQHRRRPPKKMQEKLDKQQNERMKKHQREQFVRCDKDKDEFLSFREAASMHCNMYTEMFDARDKDGDLLISEDEMLADVKPPEFEPTPDMREFERDMPPALSLDMKMSACDKNDNGQLELTETATKACSVDLNFFNSVDHNSDSTIDFNEIRRMHMKASFDEQDTNKDGWLDKKEFKGNRVRYM